ncbi:MAG: DUF4747 family protein [Paludibacter sp.]
MSERILQSKHARIQFINIKLRPQESQKPERYIELINSIFESKISVNTYSDKHTRIQTLYGKGTEIIHGDLVNFTVLNPDLPAFDRENNELKMIVYDPKLGPNAKTCAYFFVPEFHKFVIINPSKISINQIVKFLVHALPEKLNDNEEVDITIEKSSDAIERIINSHAKYLKVSLSYSNNDNNSYWAAALDDEYRDNGIKSVEATYKADKNNLFDVSQTKTIKGNVLLSQSNGYVEANIMEDDKIVHINTNDHPRIEKIAFFNDIAQSVLEKVKEIFNTLL